VYVMPMINNKARTSRNLRSTIASFEVEGITPSRQALNYCRLRDAGKRSCQQEIQVLKEKYMTMALK